jgi:hypothetical protein
MTAANAAAARSAISAPVNTQNFFVSMFIATPVSGEIRIPMEFSGAVTKITAQTSSGTCTLTGKVNTTNLTGTAVSATSTRSSQTYSSGNTFTGSDYVAIDISSLSSPTNLAVTITVSRTLS